MVLCPKAHVRRGYRRNAKGSRAFWEQHTNDRCTGVQLAAAGRRDTAQGIIAELERRSKESYVDHYFVATIFAALGEKDEAFALLNKACAERSYWMPWLNIDSQLDNLRSDSRFDALIQRVFALNQ